MIYTTGGVPLNKALPAAKLAYAERLHTRGPYGREFRRPVYERDYDGERLYRVVKDKLGDPMRIYRELWK